MNLTVKASSQLQSYDSGVTVWLLLYICISNGKPGLDGETVIYSKNSRELTSFTVSASSNIVNSPAKYHITKNQSVQKGRIRSPKLKLVAVKIAIN